MQIAISLSHQTHTHTTLSLGCALPTPKRRVAPRRAPPPPPASCPFARTCIARCQVSLGRSEPPPEPVGVPPKQLEQLVPSRTVGGALPTPRHPSRAPRAAAREPQPLEPQPLEPQRLLTSCALTSRASCATCTSVMCHVASAEDSGSCCSICICDLECGETMRKLECGHCFHASCIDRWFARSVLCPNCKGQVCDYPSYFPW